MESRNLLILCISIVFVLSSTTQADVKGAYWFRASEFPVSDINSNLFTHLFCAFADLNESSYRVTIPSSNAAIFSNFTSIVQKKNPFVQTLLSIGGGNSRPATFSSMASQASSRKAFIASSIRVARSNGFLGLDLDWEYPETHSDMTNMGTLFDEWRAAVAAEASVSGKAPLLLTAAVFYSSDYYSLNYPTDSIGKSLDWVNVMSYDYYSPTWKFQTSASAALYDSSSQVSTSTGIGNWTGTGLCSRKLVMGMPFYGYAWKLVDTKKNGLGASATGPAEGTGIDSDGAITYNQINAFVRNNNGITTVFNDTIVVNYCYSGTTWIGYDDVEAIEKMVSFAKDSRLLGYFAWSVSGDDNWVLSEKASSTWG